MRGFMSHCARRLRPQSSDAQQNLLAPKLTAHALHICPSGNISEAIEYHDMELMERLTDKLTTWLRKYAN